MKKTSTLYLLLVAAIFISDVKPAHAIDVTGLNQPESVIVDPETGNYYISCVNGDPLVKDSNGYITKVNSDGLIVVIKFIESSEDHPLHAPKGMAIVNGKIYIADIDVVRVYDLESTLPVKTIDFSGFQPKYLNDMTVDSEEVVYVSDMNTNQIFKIDTRKDDALDVFRSGDALGSPNGVFYDEDSDKILVATWETGQILEIDLKGRIEVLKDGFFNLDGLFIDNENNLYISSFTKGEIYKISRRGRGRLTSFQTGLVTPADIGFDSKRNMLLAPLMMDNRTTAFVLEKRNK